jgi:hypothetical protein
MYKNLKTGLSTSLVAILLSMLVVIPIPTNAVPDTYVSVINAATGNKWFNYTNVAPPPNAAGYPLGYVLANITVTNVTGLAGWSINVTWNPTLLEIASDADVYLPTDHIFAGLGPLETPVIIDNTLGNVLYGAARGAGKPDFTGSGRMCQIKFNVTKVPTVGKVYCDLVLDRVSAFATELVDQGGAGIDFTEQNGYYEYEWIVPPLPKPWLKVSPPLVEKGVPQGPSILGTPNAFFTVDILIDNLANASMLVGLQFKFTYTHTGIFRLISDLGTGNNATEGNFMNKAAWAPYGTLFFTSSFGEDVGYTKGWFYVGIAIWPNNVTGLYDWGNFPDTTGLTPGERVVCSINFEVITQEEYPPFEVTLTKAFDIEPVLGDYFYSATGEWIPYLPAEDGNFHIMGYVTGRQIDVYTQYPYPYGGQGLNQPSDMFWPQKQVELYANVTYNYWPIQNKPVAFEVRDPHGTLVTVLTAVTNETGTAHTSYRIPWPCFEGEALFGIWNITASVDIACVIVNDTLRFHFDYLIHWVKVTTDKPSYGHCEDVNVTVEFYSYAKQYYSVLITAALHDELNYPINTVGLNYTFVVGDMKQWCQAQTYNVTFAIHVEKYAVPRNGIIHVSGLSDLPINGGCALLPEITQQIEIRPEWA